MVGVFYIFVFIIMRNLIKRIIHEEVHGNTELSFSLKRNDDEFVLYEFNAGDIEFFVRFYEKEDNIWRRGYWFKEKNYFQTNIDKIKERLKTETNPRVLNRLKKEYEYFKSNVDSYDEYDVMGKLNNPLTIVNTLSKITVDFLNIKYDECNVLEIQHMKKSNEDVSTRLKLTERSISKYLNTNEWVYITRQSTSIIYKKDIELSDYNLEVY
jgi:hypothetical protein